MRRALFTALALATLAASAGAADSRCDKASAAAEEKAAQYVPRLAMKVKGKGRLHFHAAPEAACELADTFVIPGDKLIAYSEIDGWTSVMFTTADGDSVTGWVRRERLVETGRIGPAR